MITPFIVAPPYYLFWLRENLNFQKMGPKWMKSEREKLNTRKRGRRELCALFQN